MKKVELEEIPHTLKTSEYVTLGNQQNNISSDPIHWQAEDWEIDFRDLKFESKVGIGNIIKNTLHYIVWCISGAFGIVYKGKYRNGVVAIKQLAKSILLSSEATANFRLECELFAQLRPHSNVSSSPVSSLLNQN